MMEIRAIKPVQLLQNMKQKVINDGWNYLLLEIVSFASSTYNEPVKAAHTETIPQQRDGSVEHLTDADCISMHVG